MKRRSAPACPEGVRLYTGDDFNYAPLIEGDGSGIPMRLLGIFRRHRPGRRAGARGAGSGRPRTYHRLAGPDRPLSREIFARPPGSTRPASPSWRG
jgi:hypothetical protein